MENLEKYVIEIGVSLFLVVGILQQRFYPFFRWMLHGLVYPMTEILGMDFWSFIMLMAGLLIVVGLGYTGLKRFRAKKQPSIEKERVLVSQREEVLKQAQETIPSGIKRYDLIADPFRAQELDKMLKDNDIMAELKLDKNGVHRIFESTKNVPCFSLLQEGVLQDFKITPLEEEQISKFENSPKQEKEEEEKPMIKEKPEENEKIRNVKLLLEANVNEKKISGITGLTLKQIQEIKSSMENQTITIKAFQSNKEIGKYELSLEQWNLVKKLLED